MIRKLLQGGALFSVFGVLLLSGWHKRHGLKSVAEKLVSTASAKPHPAATGAPTPLSTTVVETIWKGGRKPGWDDWGWAPHDDVAGGPARVDLSNWGGWQLVKQGLAGEFGGLSFRFRAPAAYGDFLTVHLEAPGDKSFPSITVDRSRRKPAADDWTEVAISMGELNPADHAFDHVVFFVTKDVPKGLVWFDDIGLTAAPPPPPPVVVSVQMSVDSAATPTLIHPAIYGNAMDFQHYDWTMGAASRRWGGNTTSRYNWRLGKAWNTGMDWFFQNVDSGESYDSFLKENAAHGITSALTIPTIGWVAKDITSFGFPRALFGAMDSFDQWRPDSGNGKKAGKNVSPGPATLTSVEAPPSFIEQWVQAIRLADEARGARSVHEYILDNEPNLWSSTHRDVHPASLTYDELLEKTVAYASVIRKADHEAVIAGPAEWGWTGYLYSQKDMESGPALRPDRRAHDDLPLIAWYLKKLHEYEQKTGTRLLDVLDLHFYPQGSELYSPKSGKAFDERRIRSTRGLWDPSYKDESWIDEPVMLIPRMKKWVAENYPGTGISIGEWNFGGEGSIGGALAIAEALGRFGQMDVTSAYYWSNPPSKSPAYWAFRAFRNFDDKGGRFEELSLPTKAEDGTSLFASRDRSGLHYVLVALNLKPKAVVRASIVVPACAHSEKRELFQYTGGASGFGPPKALPNDGPIAVEMPPYSISVIDVHVAKKGQ